MKRRSFIQQTGMAAAAVTIPNIINAKEKMKGEENTYKMNFAPHFGMFEESAGKDLMDQLQFMHDRGFRSLEDNGAKDRPVEVQKAMGEFFAKNNWTMGVFVANKIYWKEGALASGDPDKRAEFLDNIKTSIPVAQRLGAKWATVVPGAVHPRFDLGYQTANVIETLKQASGILENAGLTIVLEPLNFRDHPSLFLTKAAQAYQICKAVDSPSVKILFDIYHQQIQEGNLIPNIEKCWDEIAYYQIGDNPGRNEPTTGEINYKNVFKYIHDHGYRGVMGMEHGNSLSGKAGEERVIQAYREVDV